MMTYMCFVYYTLYKLHVFNNHPNICALHASAVTSKIYFIKEEHTHICRYLERCGVDFYVMVEKENPNDTYYLFDCSNPDF